MTLVAIDPGMKGCVAHGEEAPLAPFVCTKLPDSPSELRALLLSLPPPLRVVMEKVSAVGPKMSLAKRMPSGASLGLMKAVAVQERQGGEIRGLLVGMGIPLEEVPAKVWQKAMPGLPDDYNERKRDVKRRMQAMYPHMRITEWMADGVAILEWSRRVNLRDSERMMGEPQVEDI